MADLKRSGVELVVEGSDSFASALERANEQSKDLSTGLGQLGESVKSEASAEQTKIGILTQEIVLFAQLNQTIDASIKIVNSFNTTVTNNSSVVNNNTSSFSDNSKSVVDNSLAFTDNSQTVTNNTTTHQKNSAALQQSNEDFFGLVTGTRAARIGIAAITAEMALLTIAAGKELPDGLREAAKGIQLIIDLTVSGFLVGGGLGAGIGALAGVILTLGDAASTIQQPIQDLNAKLDQLSKKDDVTTELASVLGVSKDVAQSFEDAAQKSPEFAKKLDDLAKAAEPVPPLIDAIQVSLKALGAPNLGLDHLGDDLLKQLRGIVSDVVGYGTIINDVKNQILSGEQFNSFADIQADAQRKVTAALKEYDQNLIGTKPSVDAIAGAQRDANAINADASKELDKLTAAQQRYAQAVQDSDHSIAQLNQRTQNEYAAAQQQFNDTVSNAVRSRDEAIANSEQSLTDHLADLWQRLGDSIANINQQLADKISDINQQLTDRVSDINQQLSDRVVSINQQLADKIINIQEQLSNKLTDLRHTYDAAVQADSDKEAQAAQVLADKLLDIERTRIQATEDLAFSTHEQLQQAQTQHDKDRIERDAREKQAIIDRTANDQSSDAQKAFQEQVNQFEKEKVLAKQTYDYQVALAKQLADQQIADVARAAQEQRAQAERTASEQIATARRTAAEQTATAQRTAAEQTAAAQKQFQEQTVAAQHSYNEQVAAAQRAEQDKLNDARRALQERDNAIALSYELERQQIAYTLQKALEAYQKEFIAIKDIGALVAAVIDGLGLLPGAGAIVGNLFGKWLENFQNILKGISSGASAAGLGSAGGAVGGGVGGGANAPTIPNNSESGGSSGFGSPLQLAGASHSLVSSTATNNNQRSNNLTVIVNDATDVQKVGMIVRREFAFAVSGAG